MSENNRSGVAAVKRFPLVDDKIRQGGWVVLERGQDVHLQSIKWQGCAKFATFRNEKWMTIKPLFSHIRFCQSLTMLSGERSSLGQKCFGGFTTRLRHILAQGATTAATQKTEMATLLRKRASAATASSVDMYGGSQERVGRRDNDKTRGGGTALLCGGKKVTLLLRPRTGGE